MEDHAAIAQRGLAVTVERHPGQEDEGGVGSEHERHRRERGAKAPLFERRERHVGRDVWYRFCAGLALQAWLDEQVCDAPAGEHDDEG